MIEHILIRNVIYIGSQTTFISPLFMIYILFLFVSKIWSEFQHYENAYFSMKGHKIFLWLYAIFYLCSHGQLKEVNKITFCTFSNTRSVIFCSSCFWAKSPLITFKAGNLSPFKIDAVCKYRMFSSEIFWQEVTEKYFIKDVVHINCFKGIFSIFSCTEGMLNSFHER